jgi:hypothetical protein
MPSLFIYQVSSSVHLHLIQQTLASPLHLPGTVQGAGNTTVNDPEETAVLAQQL